MITTQEELENLRNRLKEVSEIAIDTETNFTDLYAQRYCMGISVAFRKPGFVIPEDPFDIDAVIDGIETWYIPIAHNSWMVKENINFSLPPDFFHGPVVIFHNAKFDLAVLKKLGLTFPGKFYDTMLMAHLIDENRFSYGLDSISTSLIGFAKAKEQQRVMKKGWDEMPAYLMGIYAELDAKLTLRCYEVMKKAFEVYEEVWEKDAEFLLCLQDIEERGLIVDRETAFELQAKCKERIASIQGELGFDPAKTKTLHERLFSEPPFGYGIRITHRTPGGKPQVNERFLQSCNHPVAGLILEWRGLQKALTSYYNPYIDLTENTPRIHASFKMHGTVTGRLSCENPNLQQIPREGYVKKLFLAEPDFELWEFDYRNIEMRLAAVYSEEDILLETFRVEGDIHQRTADELGISRQHAKVINFLVIFGGQEGALAYNLGIPLREAEKILAKYKALYKKLFKTFDQAERTALNQGYVRLWTGRRRHFPYKSECRKAFNSVIQGGAFNIIKYSMVDLRQQGFVMVNQVHDSVWIQLPKTQLHLVKKVQETMEDWTETEFGLRFSTDAKRLAA